nr:hypothetical protein [Escherichia coli]
MRKRGRGHPGAGHTQLPSFRQKLNEGWHQVRIAGRDV